MQTIEFDAPAVDGDPADAVLPADDGSYGWCEETGEPIGLARLIARPVATLCVEAQARREIRERQARAGR